MPFGRIGGEDGRCREQSLRHVSEVLFISVVPTTFLGYVPDGASLDSSEILAYSYWYLCGMVLLSDTYARIYQYWESQCTIHLLRFYLGIIHLEPAALPKASP